jgi:hypothetical protein
MHKILYVIVACFASVSVSMHAQTRAPSQGSPEGIVQAFCRMDAEGQLLFPERGKVPVSALAQQKSGAPAPEITIIKDYVVHGPASANENAQVPVTFNVWGKLDSSLRFTALGGPLPSRPTLVQENVMVTRSSPQVDAGNIGQPPEGTAPAVWKISKPPAESHVSLEAAIRYIREAGYRSKDPLVRMNAQRTLGALMNIYQMQSSAVPYH